MAETKGQIKTPDQVFNTIGKASRGAKCHAIDRAIIIEECEGLIDDVSGSMAKHALIVGICQAIEHYEIAHQGTLREWTKELGKKVALGLLSEILDQKKAANHSLPHSTVSTLENIN